MYIKKTHQQYLFIKEKDLKFSTTAWMKLPEKKIMEWRGSRSKNTVFQTVIETQPPRQRRGQLVEKVKFLFCASCDSTHKIEFAQQIHKNRGRGPDHPLLPLCGNSPCVPRFLYKGRKNVSGGRGFSSASPPRQRRGFVIPESQKERVESASLSTLNSIKITCSPADGSSRTNRSDWSCCAG